MHPLPKHRQSAINLWSQASGDLRQERREVKASLHYSANWRPARATETLQGKEKKNRLFTLQEEKEGMEEERRCEVMFELPTLFI